MSALNTAIDRSRRKKLEEYEDPMQAFEIDRPLGESFSSANGGAPSPQIRAGVADSILEGATARLASDARDRLTDPVVHSPLSIENDLDPMQSFAIQPVSRTVGAAPQPSTTGAPVSDPGVTPVPGSEPDPFEIRQTRKQLSAQIRKDRAQNLKVRQDLNRARQAALREGRNEDAAAIMEQIQQIANSNDANVENLRDLLQVERSVAPRQSPEQRQAGRDALNAQLPTIGDAFAQQQQDAAESYQQRVAAIGGEALALETGLNPDDFLDESLAQFAITASPEVVDRVTNGVGLPAAPGGLDDVDRVRGLIDQGGVAFDDPLAPFAIDQSAVDRGLSFIDNVNQDRAAQEAIRDANRATAVSGARTQAAQAGQLARDFGIEDPLDQFAIQSRGTQNANDQSIIETYLNDGPSDDPMFNELIGQTAQAVEDSTIFRGITKAAKSSSSAELDRLISQADNILSTPGMSPNARKLTARKLLSQIQNIEAEVPNGLGAAVPTVKAIVSTMVDNATGVIDGEDALGEIVDRTNEGSRIFNTKLDAFRNRLRQIAG